MYSAKQADIFLNADARWNIYAGAVRSGKTWITYDLILRRLCELPDGFRAMIGRTQQTLERNVLNPMRERYGPGIVTHINSKNTVHIGGKPFYVVGADNKEAVTKIQGLGLIYAYGDEVTTWHENVFQMLKSRLSDKGAIFDGTCNPDSPTHWLKTGIIDNLDLNVKTWHFVLEDNPFLDKAFVESLKLEYAGMWYRRYILGEWCLAEGLVYDFDEERHTVDTDPDEPGDWYISVDYGTQNPCSMGLWHVTRQRATRVDEYYYSGRDSHAQRTDEEYYDALEELAGSRKINAVVVDPSASSFIATIKRHGKFPVKHALNDVLSGIRVTSSMLQAGRVVIHKRCSAAIKEFGLYSWDSKSLEDKPLKTNDHACDEIRYMCFTVLRKYYPLVGADVPEVQRVTKRPVFTKGEQPNAGP